MIKTRNKNRGFTLIEVMIYLALFGILMGGTIVAVFNILESTDRNITKAMLQEEGEFLLGKVNWAASSVRAINSPPVNSTGNSMSVVKWDATIKNPIIISLLGNNLVMSRGSDPVQTLNNTNVSVSNLIFEHTFDAGNGQSPESVSVSFILSSNTGTGQTISQDFKDIVYLRK